MGQILQVPRETLNRIDCYKLTVCLEVDMQECADYNLDLLQIHAPSIMFFITLQN